MPVRRSGERAHNTGSTDDNDDKADVAAFNTQPSPTRSSRQNESQGGPSRQPAASSASGRPANQDSQVSQGSLDQVRQAPSGHTQAYAQFNPDVSAGQAQRSSTSGPIGRAPAVAGFPRDQAAEYLSRINQALGEDLETIVAFSPAERQKARIGNILVRANRDLPISQQRQAIVRRLRDMATVANTAPGREILHELTNPQAPPLVINQPRRGPDRILHTDGRDDTDVRTEVLLTGQAGLVVLDDDGHRPSWADPDQTPSDVKMFIYLSMANTQMNMRENDRIIYPNGVRTHASAAESAGLGPFESNRLSENAYRDARGLDRRTFVSNSQEIGSNGWGNGADLNDLYSASYHVESESGKSGNSPPSDWRELDMPDSIRNLASDLNQILGLNAQPTANVSAVTHAILSVQIGNTTFRAHSQDNRLDQLWWLQGIMTVYRDTARSHVGKTLYSNNFAGPLPIIVGKKIPGLSKDEVLARNNVIYMSLSNDEDRANDTDADFVRDLPRDARVIHENKHVETLQSFLSPDPRSSPETIPNPNNFVKVNGHELLQDELRAVGLGPFENETTSENAYRAEIGLPRRMFYSDPDEISEELYGPVSSPYSETRSTSSEASSE